MSSKIIIAEDGKLIGSDKSKIEANGDFEVVKIFREQNELIETIEEGGVDVVLLDFILKSGDGFGALEKIAQIDITKRPKVIIVSALSHKEFINKAISLGASGFIAKPYSVSTLISKMTEVVEVGTVEEVVVMEDYNSLMPKAKNPSEQRAFEQKITNIFISVGIPAHIKGYQFLREAIKLCAANPAIINSITKQLYPSIAERFQTSASKVERAIRHAIEVAWNRGRIESINNMFGFKVYGQNDKPTNGEFIALIADRMLIEGA
jgi:two-component system response regulator (stage 0 sporulation protein A)